MMKVNSNWIICALLSVFTLSSCQDEILGVDTSESIVGSTSTPKTNVNVNYTVALFDASDFSVGSSKVKGKFKAPSSQSTAMAGIQVSITQDGVIKSQLTGDDGMTTFTNFYQGVLSVSINSDTYTSVKYQVTVNPTGKVDSLSSTLNYSNLIPLFKLSGTNNVATISGIATYESDLTNLLPEIVPKGTTILAAIDATPTSTFYSTFLDQASYASTITGGGKIMSFAYQTRFSQVTDSLGHFSIVVPAAVQGLPFSLSATEIAATQLYYEDASIAGYNQSKTSRTIYGSASITSPIPSAGGAKVDFISGFGASASATISGTGEIDKFYIVNGGSGYTSVPRVVLTGGGGSGATGTAVIVNGVVVSITVTSRGVGYTSNPIVSLVSGSGAVVSSSLTTTGNVYGVKVLNSGSGYTTAPTVTFSAPQDAAGIPATATATISGTGNVTSISIVDAGSGYTSAPSITISAPSNGTVATATPLFSGFGVKSVIISNAGSEYTGNPTIVFSDPDLSYGTKAQGVATVNISTGNVVGFTITNQGSGYTSAPSCSVITGSGASAMAVYSGKILTGITVLSQGDDYTSAPTVLITGGGGIGATASAIVTNGRLEGFQITNAGTGYISAPTIQLISGSGAQASVIVSNGKITAIKLVNGGSGYTGSPTLKITPNPFTGPGAGATATATVDVATGELTGISITKPGTGYLGGNVPSTAVPFGIQSGATVTAKPGLTYFRDIYFGTGMRTN